MIRSVGGKHILFHADSERCRYEKGFSLVLTSPPYYNPTLTSSKHGIGITGDIEQYACRVAEVLSHCSRSVIGRRVCFIKTDVWYKGALIPVGWEIMSACARRGLQLRAHWIWQRHCGFSPYGPGFSNIFVLGDAFSRPHFSGLVTKAPVIGEKGLPRSFAPEIFGVLVKLLTQEAAVVLDPFAGIGRVMEAAAVHGRRSVGVELSRSQIHLALKRLHRVPGFVFKKMRH